MATPPPDLQRFRVDPARAVLFIIDFQERLAAAMVAEECRTCARNIALFIELARRRAMPIVLSEQYPKGLGPTVSAIREPLSAADLSVHRFEKLHFACTSAPPFQDIFRTLRHSGRDQFIVVGTETHVCVFQTVRGLLEAGVDVMVPADAVASRDPANKTLALTLLAQMGAVITATELAVFDAVGTAGTDEFKALARFIK